MYLRKYYYIFILIEQKWGKVDILEMKCHFLKVEYIVTISHKIQKTWRSI